LTVDVGLTPPNPYIYTNFHPSGTPNYFFRVTPNDRMLGQTLAGLVVGWNYQRIFVVDDVYGYGQQLIEAFRAGFASYAGVSFFGGQIVGGTIVGSYSMTERFNPMAADAAHALAPLTPVVDAIIAATPDLIVYGGTTDSAIGLKQALFQRLGVPGPPDFVVGDAITGDPDWLTQQPIPGMTLPWTNPLAAGKTLGLVQGSIPARREVQSMHSTAPPPSSR
jgi:hypothetical protein